MSRKKELIKVLDTYQNKYFETEKKIQEVQKNTTIVEEYKQQEIQKISAAFAETTRTAHETATRLLEEGRKALESKWTKNTIGKLTDSDYQIGVNSLLSRIRAGVITQPQEIKNIVEMYRDDIDTLQCIGYELGCNPATRDLKVFIPEDHRKRNRELLDQVKSNIDKYISVTKMQNTRRWNTFNTTPMNLQGIITFLDEKLDDNFELK